jgi:outer membrane protein
MMLDLLEAMGARLDAQVTLTTPLQLAPSSQSLADYLLAAASNRGSLDAAAQRVRAAQAGLSSARGSQGPQVLGFAMSDTFTPEDEMGKSSGYTFGINISLPLFDAGMRSSEVSAAQAAVDRALAEQTKASLAVEKQVRAAWLDYGTAQANYTNARAALEAGQSAYDVILLRVENGKGILVEQLDALAALTRARANVSRATYELQIAVARLERSAGLTYAVASGGK